MRRSIAAFLFIPFVFLHNAFAVLPVVSPEDFVPGRTWHWHYLESSGRLYSIERYRVVARTGGLVEFEMATSFDGGANFNVHHHLFADVNRCLLAYRVPDRFRYWTVRLLPVGRPQLGEMISMHPTAFEEKFNCNPWAQRTPLQQPARYRDEEGTRTFLIQRDLAGATKPSWFDLEGPERGIARSKDFYQNGVLNYRFRRVSPSPFLEN